MKSHMNDRTFKSVSNTAALLVLLFMLLPIIILFLNAFNPSKIFEFPPRGFTFRWFVDLSKSEEYRNSISVSAVLASSAVGLALITGVPAAFAIDRYRFPGRNFMQGLFLSPLLLPSIIWALGLVQYYAFMRILGTFPGMVMAHCIIIIPYVIRLVLASLSFVDRELENAARSLGASPVRTFFEVTIPLVTPGIIISTVFGFMISFTDVVISSFVSGARYITFPVRIYSQLRSEGIDPKSVAFSAVIMLIIIIIAMIGEKTIHWSKYV